MYYNFGFDKPPFKSDEDTDGHGDYVEFGIKPKSDIAAEFVKGTGKIVKNAPARTKPEKKGSSGPATAKKSDLFGEIGGYNTEDDIKRMSWSNARAHALEAVKLLHSMDGLPEVSKAKDKAAQAKRYEQITLEIDKLTVKYFYDAATLRQLEAVADEAKAPSVASLPDDVADIEAEYEASDTPPPDPDEEVVGF